MKPTEGTHAAVQWAAEGRDSFLFGAGATPAEKRLVIAAALLCPLLLYASSWHAFHTAWSWWQWALAAGVAFDIGGGVVANACNAMKRDAHGPAREPRTPVQRLLRRHPLNFALLHPHPILLALAFGGTLAFALLWYVVPLIATACLMRLPLYLHRPFAFLVIAAGTVLALHAAPAPAGFEWFVPLFLMKLVYGHAVREEPYGRAPTAAGPHESGRPHA